MEKLKQNLKAQCHELEAQREEKAQLAQQIQGREKKRD